MTLPLGAAPVGDMFQKKTDKLFSGMPNVFGIADYNLIVGFIEQVKDHDEILEMRLQVCREANLKPYMLLGIAAYYSKFPVVKKADGLLADNLIGAAKIVST